MSHKLWSPPEGIRTNLDDFKEIIRNKYQIPMGILSNEIFGKGILPIHLDSYWDLYQWSVKNIGQFWEEFSIYSDVKYSVTHEEVGQWVEVVYL